MQHQFTMIRFQERRTIRFAKAISTCCAPDRKILYLIGVYYSETLIDWRISLLWYFRRSMVTTFRRVVKRQARIPRSHETCFGAWGHLQKCRDTNIPDQLSCRRELNPLLVRSSFKKVDCLTICLNSIDCLQHSRLAFFSSMETIDFHLTMVGGWDA